MYVCVFSQKKYICILSNVTCNSIRKKGGVLFFSLWLWIILINVPLLNYSYIPRINITCITLFCWFLHFYIQLIQWISVILFVLLLSVFWRGVCVCVTLFIKWIRNMFISFVEFIEYGIMCSWKKWVFSTTDYKYLMKTRYFAHLNRIF